jgi:DNA-binding transcriptional LysR family regulator
MKNSDPNWFLRARLKTRQLLLLIALDDTRNIHRAASELNMTQPAASKQLKDLEDMLGVSLFERLPRGMRPTIYGEAMIRHARMALTSLSKAHEDIVALKSGLSGQVDVGVILSPGMALLPPAIARVKEQAPMLRIGVEVESSNILLSRLLHGELDFIIGRILDEEARGGLLYEELADEPVCAVARGPPFHTRTDLSLADLASEAWIMAPKGSILRARCDQMFRERPGAALQRGRHHRHPVHHQPVAADRFHLRHAHRGGALLHPGPPDGHPAHRAALPHGRLWHHHAPGQPALAGRQPGTAGHPRSGQNDLLIHPRQPGQDHAGWFAAPSFIKKCKERKTL